MTLRLFRRGRRDERGTVAIISAASAIVLFGIGAMAVDLGNAFARARDVQASADFAAIAGGTELPGVGTTATAADPAVVAVADYLNRNQPLDQDAGVCQKTNTCVDPSDLVDGDYNNGEVVFLDGGYKMRVYSPRALVKFGLGAVLGVRSTDLIRSAEVGVYSPAKSLPFYVGEACSWGTQQIVDPPPGNGAGPSNNPTLTPASGTYQVKGLWIDPDYVSSVSAADAAAGLAPSITVHIDKSLDPTVYDQVGFSRNGGASTSTVALDPTTWGVDATTGDHTYTVQLPADVATTQDYFYVRLHRDPTVYGGTTGWSKSKAVLEVDQPQFAIGSTCNSVNDGNFGSLYLPRDDANDVGTTLAMNTIMGLEHSVGLHPAPSWALAENPQCPTDASVGSYRPTGPPDPNVDNCVGTDTGNPQTATQGLVTGIEDKYKVFHKGLLDASNDGAATTCNASGTTANRTMPSLPAVDVNDDVLTCFFTNDSVTVGDVASPSFDKNAWSTDPVISADIFQSPRFVYLPVLTDDPNRGSKYWPIIDFRAAFITGQDINASKTSPEVTIVNGNDNGLVWKKKKSQGLAELHVVLINNDALPEIAQVPGDVIRYIGSGTKVIRLID